METQAAPNRKTSTVPVPAGGHPLVRGPLGSGQPTAALRYPPSGTRVRGVVPPAANVKQAPQAVASKNAWRRAAIAVHDNTTTTVAADARRAGRAGGPAANGDNRPIQPQRDKHRGWAPCVLSLAAASVLVLITTAYYLVHGHLPGHLRQPELLDVSHSSTPWSYATGTNQISTLNESVVAVNTSEVLEETEDIPPPESSSATPTKRLKKRPEVQFNISEVSVKLIAENSSTTQSGESNDDEDDDAAQQETDDAGALVQRNCSQRAELDC